MASAQLERLVELGYAANENDKSPPPAVSQRPAKNYLRTSDSTDSMKRSLRQMKSANSNESAAPRTTRKLEAHTVVFGRTNGEIDKTREIGLSLADLWFSSAAETLCTARRPDSRENRSRFPTYGPSHERGAFLRPSRIKKESAQFKGPYRPAKQMLGMAKNRKATRSGVLANASLLF